MENSSYALYIATGTLVAILILTFIVFRWRQISALEKSKDDVTVIKNKAEFNAEYEVYNKSLMYGTDVLSCLNKAQNNNQKYVYNNYYGTDTSTMGKEGRVEYFIDVEVTLNKPLADTIKTFYKDKTGKYKGVTNVNDFYKNNYNTYISGILNKLEKNRVYYYFFKNGKLYQESQTYTQIMLKKARINGKTINNATLYDVVNSGGEIVTEFKGGVTYNLLTTADTDNYTTTSSDKFETAKLAALISTVKISDKIYYNPKTKDNLDEMQFNGADWWYCAWTSAASDFKTRKFKCTGVEYNNDTGYINKLKFIEFEEAHN